MILLDYYDDVYQEVANEIDRAVTTYVLVVLFVFLALAVAVGVYLFMLMHAEKQRAEHQKTVNSSLPAKLREANFTPTRTFYFCDKVTFKKTDDYKQMLFVDSEHNKLGLVDYDSGKLTVVDYSKIVNYELYENGTLQVNGAAIGGMGLGAFSAQTNHICKELRLIIRMNSTDNPHIAYQIVASKGIFNLGIGKNSVIYRTCFPTVQEVISLLQVILKQNKESQ